MFPDFHPQDLCVEFKQIFTLYSIASEGSHAELFMLWLVCKYSSKVARIFDLQYCDHPPPYLWDYGFTFIHGYDIAS